MRTSRSQAALCDTLVEVITDDATWGVSSPLSAPHREVTEHCVSSLLQLARHSDCEAVRNLAHTRLSTLLSRRTTAPKLSSTAAEALSKLIPRDDLDSAISAAPKLYVRQEHVLPGNTLYQANLDSSVTNMVDQITTGVQQRALSDQQSAVDAELLGILQQLAVRIGRDEYRAMESQQLFVPMQCTSDKQLICQPELSKPLAAECAAFLASDKKVLVLQAPAGSGKTLFSQCLEQTMLREYLRGATNTNSDGRIPLRIEMRGLRDPVHEAVQEGLDGKGFTASHIAELKKRKVLIIMDGVDEARYEGQRLTHLHPLFKTNKLDLWADVKVVFGVRIADQLQGDPLPKQFYPYDGDAAQPLLLQQLYLCPFTAAHKQEYLLRYLQYAPQDWKSPEHAGWTADRYLRLISFLPSSAELSSKPFTLRIIADVLPPLLALAAEDHPGATEEVLVAEYTEEHMNDNFIHYWITHHQDKLFLGNTSGIPPEIIDGLVGHAWGFAMGLADLMFKENVTKVRKVRPPEDRNNRLRARYDPKWDKYLSSSDPRATTLLRMIPLKDDGDGVSFLHFCSFWPAKLEMCLQLNWKRNIRRCCTVSISLFKYLFRFINHHGLPS